MPRFLNIIICVCVLWIGSVTPAMAAAEFKLLAPDEDSFMDSGQVLIIGKIDGFADVKMVELFDNGKTLGFAPVQKWAFMFKANLAPGKHQLALAAPGVKRRMINVLVGKQKGYVYHIDPEPGSCAGCHDQAGQGEYELPLQHDGLCYECHDRKSEGKYVHGPVAAGSCTPCHDPHGSRYGSFLRTTGRDLCMFCHSQNMSQSHIEERRNRDCINCHDPHSSRKTFHLK